MFSLNDMNVVIVGNKTFASTLNVFEGLCYGVFSYWKKRNKSEEIVFWFITSGSVLSVLLRGVV